MRKALYALAALAVACSRGSPPPPAPTAAATAAPAPAGGPTPGSTAEGQFWQVALEPPPSFRAGAPAAARVRIAARGGYHVNLDYPAAFVPAPGSSADFGAARIPLEPGERTACAEHPSDTCAVAASLPLTPRPGPELRIAGTLAFSVCSAERCLIEKAPLQVVSR
jgi:hypothetical protein